MRFLLKYTRRIEILCAMYVIRAVVAVVLRQAIPFLAVHSVFAAIATAISAF